MMSKAYTQEPLPRLYLSSLNKKNCTLRIIMYKREGQIEYQSQLPSQGGGNYEWCSLIGQNKKRSSFAKILCKKP